MINLVRAICTAGAIWVIQAAFGFEPRDYAFLLTAEIATDPTQIVISWPQKQGGEISVRRKLSVEENWGPTIAILPADATSLKDVNVQRGLAYDYEFSAYMEPQDDFVTVEPKAYGYIRAGVEIPAEEGRGRVALIVDDRFTNDLNVELETLRM